MKDKLPLAKEALKKYTQQPLLVQKKFEVRYMGGGGGNEREQAAASGVKCMCTEHRKTMWYV